VKFSKRKIGSLIAAFSLVLICSPLSSADSLINISDQEISLPMVSAGETPAYHRVVAMANGSAEIIAALGAKNILVGRDIASTLPELTKIPIDDPGRELSPELVISQHPDLMIIDGNTSPSSAISTIESAGIKVISITDAFSLADIYPKEEKIAKILNLNKALAKLNKLATAQSFPKLNIPVAFLYLRGTASIYLIGGKGSGADSLINKCGDVDVGAKFLNQPFNQITSESLITAAPKVFLLMTKGLQSVNGIKGLQSIPGVAQTQAGSQGRVVTVDDSLLLSFGPRTSALLNKLCPAIAQVAK
jgi:iron complex transport system substrate-binding protein